MNKVKVWAGIIGVSSVIGAVVVWRLWLFIEALRNIPLV